MNLKIGDCFYQKNFNKYKYHVVAIIDSEEQIVFKYFGKRKQWWHYEIKSFQELDEWFKVGLYYKK